jgi:hypothetical protein
VSEHDEEYRDLLARTLLRDREAIVAHWELGALFARYGEPVTAVAQAIGRSVTYVADHVAIARLIPARGALDRILENRDDITSWTVLADWARAGGPGQDSDDDPDAAEISRQRRRPAHRDGQHPQGGSGGQHPQGGGAQASGLQLTVPAHVIKALADLGANPREVLHRFWQNAAPGLIISVAYPDRVPAAREQEQAAV